MTHRDAALATPAGRLPAAAVMLFLSVCGMAIGLAIDCGVTPPALLAALCAASSGSLAATLSFHVAVMPASYAMMGAAAVLAAAFNEANAAREPCAPDGIALRRGGGVGHRDAGGHVRRRLAGAGRRGAAREPSPALDRW